MGGALFSYEMSKTTTFWKFQMIWKIFAASALGNAVFSGWDYFTDEGNENPSFNTSTLKFGKLTADTNAGFSYLLGGSIWFGIICGLLGPLFLTIN